MTFITPDSACPISGNKEKSVYMYHPPLRILRGIRTILLSSGFLQYPRRLWPHFSALSILQAGQSHLLI